MRSVTDYFIPDDFAAADTIKRRQAEVAVKTVFVLVPWGVISAIYVYWLLGTASAAFAIATVTFLVALSPLVLRQTGSLKLASLFILLPLFLAFSGWALATGGVLAPGASWLTFLPLLVLIFHGVKMATVWVLLVLLTWTAMYVGGDLGIIEALDVTDERFPIRRMLELVVLSTTTFGLFYLKDSLQDWLIGTVKTKEGETRAVLETAPDGILTLNPTGIVLSANEAATRIFEKSSTELVGATIESLIPTLTSRHLLVDQESLTRFGTTEEHSGQRNGARFPVEIAFGLLDNGRQHIVLVMRDITARKETESELRRARDQAMEANLAKSSFLANMSHELRTPLNAVIGYSEMIVEEIDHIRQSNEPGAEVASQFIPDLERIELAGQHLLSLINDTLDLSKIEAGKITTHIERFAVEELLQDIMTTVRPLARKRDNTLELDLDDDIGEMCTDATKVRQILFNLLSNACKFTRQGNIRLAASLGEENDQIVFAVEDTGIGMSREHIDTIFDAFSQADASTTREFGGTGLGLTIASHFCDLLGGDIEVTSTLGEGSRFTVRLARDLSEPRYQAESDSKLSSKGV